MITDAELDVLYETAMRQQFERDEKAMEQDGLEIIERLNRCGLLFAMDWQGTKLNTKRLRNRVRKRFLSKSPWCDHYILQQAQNACRNN